MKKLLTKFKTEIMMLLLLSIQVILFLIMDVTFASLIAGGLVLVVITMLLFDNKVVK